MYRINKVKHDRKRSETTVEYEIVSEKADDIVTVKLVGYEKPLEDFMEQFNALTAFVEEICSLPEGYCDKAEIKGVSFSWSHDIMGAVITAAVPVDTANSPVIINTPHLPKEDYSGNNPNALLLPRKCAITLEKLIEETKRYIDFERQTEQTKLDI